MEIWLADQQSQTQLNIIGVTREDLRSVLSLYFIIYQHNFFYLRSYLCVARNSMGEMSRKIKLTGKTSLQNNNIPLSVGTHLVHF